MNLDVAYTSSYFQGHTVYQSALLQAIFISLSFPGTQHASISSFPGKDNSEKDIIDASSLFISILTPYSRLTYLHKFCQA